MNDFLAARRAGGIVAALSLAGLINACVLTREHFLFHTDPGYLSFCDFNEGFTCKGVALSPWSVFLGVPVSVWGILGTISLGLAGLWPFSRRYHPRAAAGALLLLSAGAVASSLVLSAVSTFLIGALCPLCLLSHALNGLTAATVLIAARKLGGIKVCISEFLDLLRSHWLRGAGAAAAGVTTVLTIVLGYPPYWTRGQTPPPAAALQTGVTDKGSPWIGAEHPDVTIVEYSDYQCPHCRRAHQEVRKAIAENSSCMRLVHCQFPLDQHCNPMVTRQMHERACDLACMAVCAGEQGKFWEANDFLFDCPAQESLSSEELAHALRLDRSALDQCLASDRVRAAVKRDIEEGMALGVRGTPTFVIDGKLHPGKLPEEVLHHSHGSLGG